MFNGQVMSWTTQDSQVPRIGLQCRRFPPICPKPGQKRDLPCLVRRTYATRRDVFITT